MFRVSSFVLTVVPQQHPEKFSEDTGLHTELGL